MVVEMGYKKIKTVQDLIDALALISNKNLPVYLEVNGGELLPVAYIDDYHDEIALVA
jgi:hypothetical protein